MAELPASHGLSRGTRQFIGVAALLLLAFAWPVLKELASQLFFSLGLTLLGLPIAKKMEKSVSRSLSAAGAVFLLVFLFLGLLSLLLPLIISQISLLADQAPGMVERLKELWKDFSSREWVKMLALDHTGPDAWLSSASQWIGESLPKLIAAIVSGINAVSKAFLAPVSAYYLIRDREMFSYKLSLWIPLRHRRRVLTALKEMRNEAGGYIRGQTMVALAVAFLTGLALLLTGIPAWLVLGLMMGLCEFIPYIGPLIGGIPIALISLPMGLHTALWALGLTIAVQQIEGYFLSPRLVGDSTGLHPISVLILLTLGGNAGGLLGMMAAVPLFVCLRGAVRVLYETREE